MIDTGHFEFMPIGLNQGGVMAYKFSGFKTFKIDEHLTAICQAQRTNYGFRHLASLCRDGSEIVGARASYYNRTWESYEYQSVILKAIRAAGLNQEEEARALAWANGDHADRSMLNTVAGVAMLGNILCGTQAEKNDWKKRMLAAGLTNSGLEFPEDWGTLSEDEKERRLNGAIEQLK
jgi:hypothetical protein